MLALITNAIEPYYWDIARLLALPPGQNYRFRYTRGHLGNVDLIGATDVEGVVIVRDFDTACLIPLLLVTIRRVQTYGDVVYFQMRVGRFPSCEEKDQITTAANRALAEIGEANTPGNHLVRLVFNIACKIQSRSVTAPEGLADNWDAAVEALGRLPCFLEFNFLRAARLTAINQPAGDCNLIAGNLRPGQGYTLEVLQRSLPERSLEDSIRHPFHMRLIAEEGITVISGAQSIVGRYDVLRFSFRTDRLGRASIASMVLTRNDVEPSLAARVPDLLLQFAVVPSNWTRFWTFLKWTLGAIGLLGTVFAKGIADHSVTIGVNITEDMVRGVAWFVVIMSTTGALAEVKSAIAGKAPEIRL